jgi:large subunit ribosomal protein L30
MATIKITQVRSTIKRPQDQKDTLRALGLRKISHSVEQELTPVILGMVRKVNHLITIEEL